jgi:hypothetical protein
VLPLQIYKCFVFFRNVGVTVFGGLSKFNTDDEIKEVVEHVKRIVGELRKV